MLLNSRVEGFLGRKQTVADFASRLASDAHTPAGGGTSAVVAALAAALAQKSCSITAGKERYADVQQEIEVLSGMLEVKRNELLALMEEDAKACAPLFEVFALPKTDPTREEKMQPVLLAACEPQRKTMKAMAELIDILGRLDGIGSRLSQTDVATAAVLARGALEGAALNIYVNTSLLADREKAKELFDEAEEMLKVYGDRSVKLCAKISNRLKDVQ